MRSQSGGHLDCSLVRLSAEVSPTHSWTPVLVIQSWPTLCDFMDCSLLDSSAHGILQARILECVTTVFSRGSSQPRNRTQVSCIANGFFTELPGLLTHRNSEVTKCMLF